MKMWTPPASSVLRVAALAAIVVSGCSDAADRATPASTGTAATSEHATLPGEPLAAVMREPDRYARVRRLATLLPTLGPESIPEIREVVSKDLRMGVAEFELLMRRWSDLDASAASRWAVELSAPRYRQPAVEVAVSTWARNDPSAALAGTLYEIDSMDRELAQAVQQSIVRGWFLKDRVELEKYIQSLGSGISQQRAILAYALALDEAEGSDALIRWAEAIPATDERYKLAVYRQVTSALAWTNPKAAQRWCDAHCDGEFGSALRNALVRTWLNSGEDGADVLAWVSRAPDGESKDFALSIAFETWAGTEREPALRWMEQKIAEGLEPWVRTLLPAYARLLAANKPLEAIHWAGEIPDPALREEMLVRIARKWLRKDNAAAMAWLDRSPLSEQARKRAQDPAIQDYLPEAPPGS